MTRKIFRSICFVVVIALLISTAIFCPLLYGCLSQTHPLLAARLLRYILSAAVLALLISIVLAAFLSRRLVEPLNSLDLAEPLDRIEYEELRPLLSRLDSQQKQLLQDKEELEKTEQIRREFTANVSHELKTPLHSISGYAELLANGMVQSQDIQRFAEKIYTESHRMTSLVEDIIDLSRLDTGESATRMENCDLYMIAQNAIDSLSLEAESADVSLILKGESAPIYGVPHLLYGICFNLCDNAIKYNREKGSVTVTVRSKKQEVVLTVSDTGIGIPKEDQDRVFERFYRIDKSRSKAVGGTGLGLSIVKHAVLIHKASISMDSSSKGTSFTVHFPRLDRSRSTNELSAN